MDNLKVSGKPTATNIVSKNYISQQLLPHFWHVQVFIALSKVLIWNFERVDPLNDTLIPNINLCCPALKWITHPVFCLQLEHHASPCWMFYFAFAVMLNYTTPSQSKCSSKDFHLKIPTQFCPLSRSQNQPSIYKQGAVPRIIALFQFQWNNKNLSFRERRCQEVRRRIRPASLFLSSAVCFDKLARLTVIRRWHCLSLLWWSSPVSRASTHSTGFLQTVLSFLQEHVSRWKAQQSQPIITRMKTATVSPRCKSLIWLIRLHGCQRRRSVSIHPKSWCEFRNPKALALPAKFEKTQKCPKKIQKRASWAEAAFLLAHKLKKRLRSISRSPQRIRNRRLSSRRRGLQQVPLTRTLIAASHSSQSATRPQKHRELAKHASCRPPLPEQPRRRKPKRVHH